MKTEIGVEGIEQHDAFLTSQGRVFYLVVVALHEHVQLVGELGRQVVAVAGRDGAEAAVTHVQYAAVTHVQYAAGRVFIGIGADTYMAGGTYHEGYVIVGVGARGGGIEPFERVGQETVESGIVLLTAQGVGQKLRQEERYGALEGVEWDVSERSKSS